MIFHNDFIYESGNFNPCKGLILILISNYRKALDVELV